MCTSYCFRLDQSASYFNYIYYYTKNICISSLEWALFNEKNITMICPQLVSNYSTPKIRWYQTDLTVIISIQLIDVSDYYLRVKDTHLLFRYICVMSNRKKKVDIQRTHFYILSKILLMLYKWYTKMIIKIVSAVQEVP